MKNANHVNEAWTVERGRIVTTHGKQTVISAAHGNPGPFIFAHPDDLQLAAAAPELLRELQSVVALLDRGDLTISDRGWAIDNARAAIAKATGQEGGEA
jgi:hypothetical protein